MKGKKGRSAHCNKSCLVVVGVLLASRAFQHNNSHVNRIFQQNNPRCSHQIQIQKPGTRPNSASPIASSQQLSSHLYQSQTHNSLHLQAIATRAHTEISIAKKKGGSEMVGRRVRVTYYSGFMSNRAPRVEPLSGLPLRAFSSGGCDERIGRRRRSRGTGGATGWDGKRGNFEVGGTASHIGGGRGKLRDCPCTRVVQHSALCRVTSCVASVSEAADDNGTMAKPRKELRWWVTGIVY